MEVVRGAGQRLLKARPVALVIGNIVRRVLFIIREEYSRHLQEPWKPDGGCGSSMQAGASGSTAAAMGSLAISSPPPLEAGPSLHNILSDDGRRASTYEKTAVDLRNPIIEGIQELQAELENLDEPIASQALEHIHANEVVLVYGESHSVEVFLRAAAGPPGKRKRTFEVIVAEAAPEYSGTCSFPTSPRWPIAYCALRSSRSLPGACLPCRPPYGAQAVNCGYSYNRNHRQRHFCRNGTRQ